jgi:hypothetical protein
MTVTAAMIAEISPFEVDDETEFTKAVFTRLSAVAKAILDKEDPGLDSTLYDHAHALLICHLYESVALGRGAMKSESIGDYSYSKESGATSYLIEYRSVLLLQSGPSSSSDTVEEQERTDHAMAPMQLDQSATPKYTSGEEDVE